MTEKIIPGLTVYWWVVLDMSDDLCGVSGHRSCSWNRKIMSEYNCTPTVHFPSSAAAFADFVAKNPTLIEGEMIISSIQYNSGKLYNLHRFPYPYYENTIILAKDQYVAVLLRKIIVDKSKLPEAQNTVATLTEVERLRLENAALRAEIKATKPAPSFFLPSIDTLEETRENANAFAAFYGYFIVNCSSFTRGVAPATTCGFSHGNKIIRNLKGVDCSALTFRNVKSRKQFAYLLTNARKLGLTKKVKQAVMPTDVFETPYKGVERFADYLLLEHVEMDGETPYEIGKAVPGHGITFYFRSNLPLLQFLNDGVRGKALDEMSIPWINKLDREQAWHMLQGMMIASSDKDSTIELMSPLLATCVEQLCEIAGYSCKTEQIGDMMWIVRLMGDSWGSFAASSFRDPC